MACGSSTCSPYHHGQINLKFCLVHFQKATEAVGFFKTYSCRRNSLCKKLSGIYANEAIFSGIKANYDLSTTQTRLTPTRTWWCHCKSDATSNDQSDSATTSNSNPTTTTTTITSNPIHNNEDKRGVKRILQQLRDEAEI
ncbi:hypothetical protein PS15p_200444 [Mucor circinelloides]